MKLLLDENLSPRLIEYLSELYPETTHVHRLEMGASDDTAIWEFAKANGFAIVSKDADFAERGVLESNPPKVVWLRVGNCSTDEVGRLLRDRYEAIQTFLEQDPEICLVLLRV